MDFIQTSVMYKAGTAGETSFLDEVTIPNTFFFLKKKLNFRLDVENPLSFQFWKICGSTVALCFLITIPSFPVHTHP